MVWVLPCHHLSHGDVTTPMNAMCPGISMVFTLLKPNIIQLNENNYYCQLRQELLQIWWAINDNSVEVLRKCIRNLLQMYTGFHASTQLCVALHIALRLLHLGRTDVIFLFLLDSCLSISLIREKLLKMLRSLKITQKGKRELLNSDRLQEPIKVKKAGRCENKSILPVGGIRSWQWKKGLTDANRSWNRT